jgi:hypothetical protein
MIHGGLGHSGSGSAERRWVRRRNRQRLTENIYDIGNNQAGCRKALMPSKERRRDASDQIGKDFDITKGGRTLMP